MNIDTLIADAQQFKISLPETGSVISEAAAQVTACHAAAQWLEGQGRADDAAEARRWGALHNERFVKLWSAQQAAVS